MVGTETPESSDNCCSVQPNPLRALRNRRPKVSRSSDCPAGSPCSLACDFMRSSSLLLHCPRCLTAHSASERRIAHRNLGPDICVCANCVSASSPLVHLECLP